MERALAKTRSGLALRPHRPSVGRGDVEIAVVCAGICRTDLLVASGRIPAAIGRVLGHELSGWVCRVGEGVERFAEGDRVTVFPIVGCGACGYCDVDEPWRCAASEMLGVSRDGGFSDRVVLPERAVYRLPDGVSFELGAYAEPVAASLAVMRAGLRGRGVVLGTGRIAELTRRVLSAHGVEAPLLPLPPGGNHADYHAGDKLPLAPRSLDFVVETVASEEAFDCAMSLLRPGGTLVLKSRAAAKVPLDVARAVGGELILRAVAYGRFADALALLSSGRLQVTDLFGPTYDLDDHEPAFLAARADEGRKVFLCPGGSR